MSVLILGKNGCEKLYDYLYNYDDGKSLPTFSELKNHDWFDKLCQEDEGDFHRKGCLLDLGDTKNACNVVCTEDSNSTIPTKTPAYVNQVLYISPDGWEFHKKGYSGWSDNFEKGYFDEENELDWGSKGYQMFLSVAYKGMTSSSEARHFAEYISATEKWRPTKNIEFWHGKSTYDKSLDFEHHGESIEKYDYYGIFVFYSIGNGARSRKIDLPCN